MKKLNLRLKNGFECEFDIECNENFMYVNGLLYGTLLVPTPYPTPHTRATPYLTPRTLATIDNENIGATAPYVSNFCGFGRGCTIVPTRHPPTCDILCLFVFFSCFVIQKCCLFF